MIVVLGNYLIYATLASDQNVLRGVYLMRQITMYVNGYINVCNNRRVNLNSCTIRYLADVNRCRTRRGALYYRTYNETKN